MRMGNKNSLSQSLGVIVRPLQLSPVGSQFCVLYLSRSQYYMMALVQSTLIILKDSIPTMNCVIPELVHYSNDLLGWEVLGVKIYDKTSEAHDHMLLSHSFMVKCNAQPKEMLCGSLDSTSDTLECLVKHYRPGRQIHTQNMSSS